MYNLPTRLWHKPPFPALWVISTPAPWEFGCTEMWGSWTSLSLKASLCSAVSQKRDGTRSGMGREWSLSSRLSGESSGPKVRTLLDCSWGGPGPVASSQRHWGPFQVRLDCQSMRTHWLVVRVDMWDEHMNDYFCEIKLVPLEKG